MSYLLPKSYLIGDALLHSHDSTETDATTTYGRGKDIVLEDLYPRISTLRIKFDLRSSSAGVTAYGRIYKNGSPVGTERSTASTSGVTYSEDISFSKGDYVELYFKSGTLFSDVYIENFRIYGSIVESSSQGFNGVNGS